MLILKLKPLDKTNENKKIQATKNAKYNRTSIGSIEVVQQVFTSDSKKPREK